MTEKSLVHHANERQLLKMLDRAYESVEERVRRIRAYYYLRRWRDRLAFFCLGVAFMLLVLAVPRAFACGNLPPPDPITTIKVHLP